jgi:YVTN family beta-propeller protein
MLFPLLRRALAVSALIVGDVAGAAAATILPGLQADGSVQLPNQWSLRPVGRQIIVGDFPVNVALHPRGQFAAVLHSGWGKHEVRILDVQAHREISQVALDETYYGLSWSPDGKHLYVSGAAAEVVHAFDFADGYLSGRRDLRVRPDNEKGVPAGLAVSADGKAVYLAEVWGQRVVKISTADGHPLWTQALAKPQGWSETTPENERKNAGFAADAPYPYTCLPDEAHGRVYVSLWAGSAVLVLDAQTGKVLSRWAVGRHPNEMALGRDGRLYVSEANSNSVSIIDTASGKVLERLGTALFPDAPPGATPNSLTLSPDGATLYVANADNNNLAVYDVAQPGRSVPLGHIPTGWYPTSVRATADGRSLVVANGKGLTSRPNALGPIPTHRLPRDQEEYIGGLLRGSVSVIALPAEKDRVVRYAEWTKTAYACSPLNSAASPRGTRPEGSPIPAAGAPSLIRHVIYIVRENRTYDQVFGDVAEGHGDAHLCLFGEQVTPNAHALAREFVLLDNLYADGEVSSDGHEWSLGAYATDFVERNWPMNYGHNHRNKYDYPSEGRYPVAIPANGYLWDRAAEAGVSYRSYGEFTVDGHGTPDTPAHPSLPVLRGHIDELYPSWTTKIPDRWRADHFIKELARFEKEGEMPRLQVLQLPCDHTVGTNEGEPTPTAMVADNDLALGRIVEAVSRSRFWADTAIFVLEDDAQNGADHIDAHRMPALVVSPWTRRHAVDSTLYSTSSMLRTIELILGLKPMSQYDAAAMPMWSSFSDRADPAPYAARPARVDLEAKNTKLAWGAKESGRMDFSAPDRANPVVLNEIIWRSVRGDEDPVPATTRAAFFRPFPKTDEDDD